MTHIRHGALLAGILTLACSVPAAAAGYWVPGPVSAPAEELLDGGISSDTAGPSAPPAVVYLQVPSPETMSLPLQAAAPVTTAGAAAPPSPIQINGVLMYRLFNDPYPPTAPGALANLNDTLATGFPTYPTINDGTVETAINWTFSPMVNLFADLSLESTTGEVSPLASSDIEETYLDFHNFTGVPGLGIRLGRDRIKLGVEGLLLDENVYDGGRRDGFEVRATQIGPVSVLGFMQYALDDGLALFNWQSSRRVWGGVVAAQVTPGWTVDAAFRADTADAAETGTCPGIGCNVGTGWSVGVEGTITPAINFSFEAATYTQLDGTAQWYYEPSIAFDLQQLLGLPAQPLLTFWYKNFDPYTPPLDAPSGNYLLPGDFSTYNINDNLTGVGGQLDLAVTPVVGVFFAGEWGTYQEGGPDYYVISMGAKWSYTSDQIVKLSYNIYSVQGGLVTTSPLTGIQLQDAQLLLFEWTKTF